MRQWIRNWSRSFKSPRSRNRRRLRSVLRLEELEIRLTPDTVTWTGNGSTPNWYDPSGTNANWMPHQPTLNNDGDSTPDILVFPAGAKQTTNTNNYPSTEEFNSIIISGNGYSLSGTGFSLSPGNGNTAIENK